MLGNVTRRSRYSLTQRQHPHNSLSDPLMARGNVASDLLLGVGFPRYSDFLNHLQLTNLRLAPHSNERDDSYIPNQNANDPSCYLTERVPLLC